MAASAPRILIVTAAFGEGHNSAAKNLSIALEDEGAITHVGDPFLLGSPGITEIVSRGYRFVTTRLPSVWAAIYRSTDRYDFNRHRSPLLRQPEKALGTLIDEFNPDALVSTYPLYPYFLNRLPQKFRKRLPVFTIVTDSIEINSAWLRAPTDWWLVTDPVTTESMVKQNLPAEKVIDTGFPVHRVFSQLSPLSSDDPCDPFRILYFPTSSRSLLLSHSHALLKASPDVRLTLAMGRNVRRLYPQAQKIKAAYPGRVRLLGWTRRVPKYLNEHHLVVGKAGGATVHEAIAARCPMLIHHLVPGQEEGNLRLLQTLGAGDLASEPAALENRLRKLLSNEAAEWRSMKDALARHDRNAGARSAAQFILKNL